MKKALSLDSVILICKAAHLFDEVTLLFFCFLNKTKIGNVRRKRLAIML